MIEEIILNYLRESGFPCYLSVPEEPSGNFVVLDKTGSGYDEGIYTATLAVQSYGSASDYDGCRAAEPSRGADHAGRGHPAGDRGLLHAEHRLQFPGHHPQAAPLSGRFFYLVHY